MVYRHPFARLASAYYNKFFIKKKPKWKTVIRSSISKYRKNETVYKEDEALPEEFLSHVLDELRRSRGNYKKVDTHWRPQHSFCAYCVFNYSVYSKLEENYQDSVYYFKKSGNIDKVKIGYERNVHSRGDDEKIKR